VQGIEPFSAVLNKTSAQLSVIAPTARNFAQSATPRGCASPQHRIKRLTGNGYSLLRNSGKCILIMFMPKTFNFSFLETLIYRSRAKAQKYSVCSGGANSFFPKFLFALAEQITFFPNSYLLRQSKALFFKILICSGRANSFFSKFLFAPSEQCILFMKYYLLRQSKALFL
jgi:hypothetical protein